jgi:hypothetical protein
MRLEPVLPPVDGLVHMSRLGIHRGDDPVLGDPAGDAPPPVGAVRAFRRFHVLPGDQRQQGHRSGGRLVQLGIGEHGDDRAGVLHQCRDQCLPGGLVVPGDRRLTGIVPVMRVAARRHHLAGAGDLTAYPPHSGNQLGHRVLGGHRVIEHRRVEGPAGLALQHAGLIHDGPDRLEDPLRPARKAQPVTPHRQRGRVEPLVVDRQPTGHLPPDVAAQRVHRFGIGPVLQGLQHQHRRDHISRHRRPPPPRREKIGEQPVREHLAPMLGQERVHTARRHQMPHQRSSVQQLPIQIRSTLHPPIIDQTRSQPAHRHAIIQGTPRRPATSVGSPTPRPAGSGHNRPARPGRARGGRAWPGSGGYLLYAARPAGPRGSHVGAPADDLPARGHAASSRRGWWCWPRSSQASRARTS